MSRASGSCPVAEGVSHAAKRMAGGALLPHLGNPRDRGWGAPQERTTTAGRVIGAVGDIPALIAWWSVLLPAAGLSSPKRQRRWPEGPGFTDQRRGADNRTCDRTTHPTSAVAPSALRHGASCSRFLCASSKPLTLILIDAPATRIAAPPNGAAVFQFRNSGWRSGLTSDASRLTGGRLSG